jgi:exosortase C (VPDSG-CTERM-specific)
MNDSSPLASALPPASPAARAGVAGVAPRAFWIALALLFVGFSVPLFHLARFAAGSDLYSHILLLPFVSLHAIWGQRATFRVGDAPYPKFIACALLAVGAGFTALHLLQGPTQNPITADALVPGTSAFVVLLTGLCFWFLGRTAMGALYFPLLILVFTIPIPTVAVRQIELVMQHGSGAVAAQLFDLSGVAVYYQDLIFQLPGVSLQVAPECSGIRSTLVLLIVSVVTSHLFLRRPVHRLLVVLVVLPLALLRTGFRIFVVGELCVNYGPQMIESYVHRHGGPFFFGLSLIPFFLLVLWLSRRERRAPVGAR